MKVLGNEVSWYRCFVDDNGDGMTFLYEMTEVMDKLRMMMMLLYDVLTLCLVV